MGDAAQKLPEEQRQANAKSDAQALMHFAGPPVAPGAVAAAKDNRLGNLILHLTLFAASVAGMFYFHWKLTQLVWSLWLSSFTVGYALIVTGAMAPVFKAKTWGMRVGMFVAGLAMLGFFTLHFGMFHGIHGVFLAAFFPFNEALKADPTKYPYHLMELAKMGWPFVLASAISSKNAFGTAVESFNPGNPYINVVRMHLLIFVFAGAKAAELDSRALYVLVLFVYFFPWADFKKLPDPSPPPKGRSS